MMIVVFKRKVLIILVFLCTIAYLIFQNIKNSELDQFEVLQSKAPKLRNWFDHKQFAVEAGRRGFGENGTSLFLSDPKEIELNEKLYQQTGFSVVVSDKISVNRSLPNVVHHNCTKFEYYAKLPNISVVIIFHNEVKSVLLRTVHSVINRTPPDLLHEIILVNDNSSNLELYEPLRDYIAQNLPAKVKVKNLQQRNGLIRTRLHGARMATGEILVAS